MPNHRTFKELWKPALTDKVAADVEIALAWKPGGLKHDGNRDDSENGFGI